MPETNVTMRQIKIEKVSLNIGCGDDHQKIEKAKKLLEILTQRRPIVTASKKRSTFGVSKGKPIGVKVTLRNKQAEEFLKTVLQAVGNKVRMSQFDKDGNLNIGIKEYIDLPGIKYMHEIGVLGFGVAAVLERPGFRVKKRKIQKRIISSKHKLNKEDAANWIKNKFGVQIAENS